MTDSVIPASSISLAASLDEVDPSDLFELDQLCEQGNRHGALIGSVLGQCAGIAPDEVDAIQQSQYASTVYEQTVKRQQRRQQRQEQAVRMNAVTTRSQPQYGQVVETSADFSVPVEQQNALYDSTDVSEGDSTDDDADYVERKNARQPVTDQERLLIAMEKRGRALPTIEKRTGMIEEEHALGHFGVDHVYDRLYRVKKVWWPGMRRDIARVLADCDSCLQYNVYMARWHPAQTITASYPGEHYQVDLNYIGRSEDGYQYMLALVDVFTGFVMLKALKTNEAEEAARALLENLCNHRTTKDTVK
jgi:hypothetical protein